MQNLQKNLGLQKFSLNGTNRLVYEKPKNPDESELYPSKTSLTLAFTPYKQNEWETKELIDYLDLNDDQMFHILKLLDTTCRTFLYKSLRPKYDSSIERYANLNKARTDEEKSKNPDVPNNEIIKTANDVLLKINEFKKHKQEKSSAKVSETASETKTKIKEVLDVKSATLEEIKQLTPEEIKQAEESGREKLAQGLDKYLKGQIQDDALVQAVITEMAKTDEGKQILSKIQLIASSELKKQILKSGVSLYTVKTGVEELRDVMDAFTDKLKKGKDNKETNSVDKADKTAGSASTDAGASGEAKAENADVDTATDADEGSGVEEIEITREEEVGEGGGDKPEKKEGAIKSFFKKIFNQKSSNGENQKPNAENLGEEEMKSINKIPEELTKGKILTLRKMKEGQADGEPWVGILENVDGIKLDANLQIGGETAGSVWFINEKEGVYLINAKWILYSFDPKESRDATQAETSAGETAQTEEETMSDEEVEESLSELLDEVIEDGEEEAQGDEVIELEEEVGGDMLKEQKNSMDEVFKEVVSLLNSTETSYDAVKNDPKINPEDLQKAQKRLEEGKTNAKIAFGDDILESINDLDNTQDTHLAVLAQSQETTNETNGLRKLNLLLNNLEKTIQTALKMKQRYQSILADLRHLNTSLSKLDPDKIQKIRQKLAIKKGTLAYFKDMYEITNKEKYKINIEKWEKAIADLQAESDAYDHEIADIRQKKEVISSKLA